MPLSIVFLRAIVGALDELGATPTSLLFRAGVEQRALDEPSGFVADRQVSRLLASAALHLRDPALALRVGATCTEQSFHVLGHVLLSCVTLREACTALRELGPVVLGGPAFRLDEFDDSARLVMVEEDDAALTAALSEIFLPILFKLVRRYVAESDTYAVQFMHARPGHGDHYAQVFPVAVDFAQPVYGVRFARRALDRPLLGRDRGLTHALRGLVDEFFVAPRTRGSWSERVRRALRQEQELNDVDFDALARRWGMSQRSLRRRIQYEGHSLSELLTHARFERASVELVQPRESIKEISERLGYAEASSFHRAFKRWAGMTPAEYRRRRPNAAARDDA